MNPIRILRAALSRRRRARAVEALGSYNTAARALDDAKRRRDTRSIHRAQAELESAMLEQLRAGA